MAYSSFKNKLLLCLCVFVVFVPFMLVTNVVNADYEEITTTREVGFGISSGTNYFIEGSTRTTRYFRLEDNYIYRIVNNSTSDHLIAVSNSEPAANVPYTFIGTLSGGETYEYIKNGQEYFFFSASPDSGIKVYREKIPGINGVVTDLVENVGIDSFWNVFENSIPFILIAITVVFGLFIIVKSLRGTSKGKGGF